MSGPPDAAGACPPVVEITEAAANWLRGHFGESGVVRLVFHIRDDLPTHGLMLENAPADGDVVVEQHGLTLVVDAATVELVRGSSIEYVDDDPDSPLDVYNPNIRIDG